MAINKPHYWKSPYLVTLKDKNLILYFGLIAIVGVLMLHRYYTHFVEDIPKTEA